jgi:hypothetical protein
MTRVDVAGLVRSGRRFRITPQKLQKLTVAAVSGSFFLSNAFGDLGTDSMLIAG